MGNEIKSNPLGQINKSVPIYSQEIETKQGNYLLLNSQEAEAIKQFTGFGNVMMNMLFNQDIDSVLPRLQHWARADENIEKSLDISIVNNVVYLYSALLKAYDYHHSDKDPQEHRTRLFRGSTGTHHSDGFKSFTEDRAMAESFGKIVFEVPFPENIPYLSPKDIYNYAPHTSRREETEYLFSPYSDIKPINFKGSFLGRPRSYVLSKQEIQYSTDNLPLDINETLIVMAKTILAYKANALTIEHLERYQVTDTDYEKALLERQEIQELYKQKSGQVLNFVAYQCSMLDEAHENNKAK